MVPPNFIRMVTRWLLCIGKVRELRVHTRLLQYILHTWLMVNKRFPIYSSSIRSSFYLHFHKSSPMFLFIAHCFFFFPLIYVLLPIVDRLHIWFAEALQKFVSNIHASLTRELSIYTHIYITSMQYIASVIIKINVEPHSKTHWEPGLTTR